MAEAPSKERQRQYRQYLQAELEAAAVYEELAKRESDLHRAEVFQTLVAAEMRHASRWAGKLGEPLPTGPGRLGQSKRLLLSMARVLGTKRVLPMLLQGEAKDIRAYASDPEAGDIAKEERHHARLLRTLSEGAPAAGPAAHEAAHRFGGGGGSIRAAVLGVNDGLVSNFSLVMGVAGATAKADFVLLAGSAGLLAGAFSMAAGEYVSVRSQRDIYEHQISIEREEVAEFPVEEREELALIYQAKGLSKEAAEHIAEHLMSNKEVALDTLVREELGLDPGQLGSPWNAAIVSCLAFCAGAIVPIIPYIISKSGGATFAVSAGVSGGALLVVGGSLALFSGRKVAWGALRMLLAGGAAAAVTYGVGRLIGVAIN